jgi:hypothetical protein
LPFFVLVYGLPAARLATQEKAGKPRAAGV